MVRGVAAWPSQRPLDSVLARGPVCECRVGMGWAGQFKRLRAFCSHGVPKERTEPAGAEGGQAKVSNSKWVSEITSGGSCPKLGSATIDFLPFFPSLPLPVPFLFLLFHDSPLLSPLRSPPLRSPASPFLPSAQVEVVSVRFRF